eukprot:TRINITY_DN649_c0_g2_i1.p1 TRINITY_DN649_c0_g2~~TRINITY_DN649_c0_g2_i1.p1  ORF type:complete len:664 (-),score=175.03 TRINITY_DN649_c0_g2_i1:115-2106(-)
MPSTRRLRTAVMSLSDEEKDPEEDDMVHSDVPEGEGKLVEGSEDCILEDADDIAAKKLRALDEDSPRSSVEMESVDVSKDLVGDGGVEGARQRREESMEQSRAESPIPFSQTEKKKFTVRRLIMAIGFTFAVIVYFIPIDRDNYKVQRTACVTLLMATSWVTEALPLAVTAFFPVILFPLMEVESGKVVSGAYFNNVVFILLGGFIVALAMERWGLHKRIAMFIIQLCGVRPRSLLLGMMISTWFLSMWISNTATTLMMIPNAMAVVRALEDKLGADSEVVRGFSNAVFLGLAYSANIGGVATLIGTPPNMIFAELVVILFPKSPPISFAQWFIFAFPLSLVLIIICWIYLSLRYAPSNKKAGIGKDVIDTKLPKMSAEEKVMLVAFISLAVLWFFRADIELEFVTIKGWSNLFRHPDYITDGTVGMLIATILFVVPARSSQIYVFKVNKRRELETELDETMAEETDPVEEESHRSERRGKLEAMFFAGKWDTKMMDWATAVQLPWDLVLLFGGGFALAEVFQSSGLSAWLGNEMEGLGSLPLFLLIFFICLGTTWLTEVTSNTAITQLLLPIMASISVAIHQHPYFLMIATAASASFCYMLPVGTPPNLAVFSSKKVTIELMFKTGIVMNVVSVFLTTVAVLTLVPVAFDCSASDFPAWAER